jgi:hypothetical protein
MKELQVRIVFTVIATILFVAGAAAAVMWLQRANAEREVAAAWHELERSGTPILYFNAADLEGLPEPAARFLSYSIAPRAALADAVVLHMHGTIRLREDRAPLPMRATQVLAPPRGFVWKAEVGSGLMRIMGYDRYSEGSGELRWWLHGLVPVVGEDGSDVTRSAAGRLAGEGILIPSSLLPGRGARWEEAGPNSARAVMDVDGEPVEFTVDVAADGRPERAEIQRWNGDPGNGPVGYMPFIVEFGEETRWFDGYRVPVALRAGWHSEDGFQPFFVAAIDSARYH